MDQWLFDRVNDLARATPWLHPLVVAYATYGVAVFGALLVLGWWIARRAGSATRMAAALCAGTATLLAVAVNQPIVDAVHRARPYTTHPHILVLAHRSADFSFPSDHSVMAGAATVGLLLVSRRLGLVAAVAAALMAFSRVYIAAHYPLDVAAGLLLGGVVALVCWAVARRPVATLVTAAGRTRLRLLVAPAGDPDAVVTGAPARQGRMP